MALKHMLLGLIALMGPRNGYTLHKDIFETNRPALAQIYQALRSMKTENLVEYNRVYTENRPGKNIFRLTPQGYVELRHWLDSDELIEPMIEHFMEKIWFSNIVGTDNIIESLEKYIAKRKDELGYYESAKKSVNDRIAKKIPIYTTNKINWLLVFDYSIKRCKLDIEFAEDAIQKLSLSNGTVSDDDKTVKKKR